MSLFRLLVCVAEPCSGRAAWICHAAARYTRAVCRHTTCDHTGAGNPEAFDNGHLVTLLQWMGIGFDKQLFVASRLDGQALGSGVVEEL